MVDFFIDTHHKNKYMKLLSMVDVHKRDYERKSLFYILAGNSDLYDKKEAIFDFYENGILVDCLTSGKVDFCMSSKCLIRLAYNLYNGYSDGFSNPLFLLGCLDSKNLFIAVHAILIRFSLHFDIQKFLPREYRNIS